MNEDIIKDLIRMRELLNINEQSPDQSIAEILKSNDVVRIKEFLLQKPDLQKKLEELFSSPTLEDLATKILNSNKMQTSKLSQIYQKNISIKHGSNLVTNKKKSSSKSTN